MVVVTGTLLALLPAGSDPGGPAGSRPRVGDVPRAVPSTVSAPGRSSASVAAAPWEWPLRPRPVLLRRFEAPASRYGPGHRGLDLATEVGHRVQAVEAGVVTHAGVVAGRGSVTVTHAGGLSSTYEPLSPSVVAGEHVSAGQLLGLVAPGSGTSRAHCGSAVCLHLGARREHTYLDPLLLLARARIRLLPWSSGRQARGWAVS
jgi:murein DD-endopeptidase MepM/ murein hydrolase activator NlpD